MNEKVNKKPSGFEQMKRVFFYVRPYNAWFVGSVLFAILIAFLSPVRPYVIQLTLSKTVHSGLKLPAFIDWVTGHPQGDVLVFIYRITIFQCAFLVFETFSRFCFSYLTSSLGQKVINDLRIVVFDKITHLNLSQFDTTPIGTFTTRTINDIESINDIFSDGLIPIISDLLTIVVTLATMFSIDWKVALVSLSPFPLLLAATYFFKESVKKSFQQVRTAVASLNAFMQEHLTGMMVVQAFAAEDKEFKKFEAINAKHRDANIKAIFAYSLFFPAVELVLAMSLGLLVWWVVGRQLDPGILVSFILYINQIFRPLRIIADKFNVIQMGVIASERVFKILDNPDVSPGYESTTAKVIKETATDSDITTAQSGGTVMEGAISFKDVWLSYKDGIFVLKNISFSVRPGEMVALVGHTGSGKTSIISLLNRLYPIQEGVVEIDGKNINDYPIEVLRRNIGVVLQDVFLFSGSIAENIALRNEHISLEQIKEACTLIGLHEFIERLPGGYDYNVMERGNTLSLGQRQLISFARAILYRPSILILDEATSSIDSESEKLIADAIEKLVSGRTSLVIAHRLSTIRKADKIIVLDKGEIVEMGSHGELMALNGFYRKLNTVQFEKKGLGYGG